LGEGVDNDKNEIQLTKFRDLTFIEYISFDEIFLYLAKKLAKIQNIIKSNPHLWVPQLMTTSRWNIMAKLYLFLSLFYYFSWGKGCRRGRWNFNKEEIKIDAERKDDADQNGN
jgi:hypothetical protein